jgi:hypothetical protein
MFEPKATLQKQTLLTAYLRVQSVAWVSPPAASLEPTMLPAGLMANA